MYQSYQTLQSDVGNLDEGAALGILQHLSGEQLQKLLDNDESLTDLINDNLQVKGIKEKKNTAMVFNKSLAEYNLSKEPLLKQGKLQLGTSYEMATDLRKTAELRQKKLGSSMPMRSLDDAIPVLQAEAAKSEEASEAIVEKFFSGALELDTFLEKFVTVKAIAHLRKVKSEKLIEMKNRGGGERQQPGYPLQSAAYPPAMQINSGSYFQAVIKKAAPLPYGVSAAGPVPPYSMNPLSMPAPSMYYAPR